MDEMKRREIIEQNHFANYCGMQILQNEDGSYYIKAEVRPEFTNPYGGVHGGYLSTMADMAAGCNAACLMESPVTLDHDLHYLRNITSGSLIATAEVVKPGRKIMVLRVNILSDTGILMAEGTVTYFNSIY